MIREDGTGGWLVGSVCWSIEASSCYDKDSGTDGITARQNSNVKIYVSTGSCHNYGVLFIEIDQDAVLGWPHICLSQKEVYRYFVIASRRQSVNAHMCRTVRLRLAPRETIFQEHLNTLDTTRVRPVRTCVPQTCSRLLQYDISSIQPQRTELAPILLMRDLLRIHIPGEVQYCVQYMIV